MTPAIIIEEDEEENGNENEFESAEEDFKVTRLKKCRSADDETQLRAIIDEAFKWKTESLPTSHSFTSGHGNTRVNLTLEPVDLSNTLSDLNCTASNSEFSGTYKSSSKSGNNENVYRKPTWLCCANDDTLEDYQIDLCPKSWFDFSSELTFAEKIWKVLFMIFCLPLCYPCYVTRKCRRKGKRVQDIEKYEPNNLSNNNSSSKHNSTGFDESTPPRTMTFTKATKIIQAGNAFQEKNLTNIIERNLSTISSQDNNSEKLDNNESEKTVNFDLEKS